MDFLIGLKMARPRTPTLLLELRGAFKNHPARRKGRLGEIKSTKPLGPAPVHLTKSQKAIWEEVQTCAFWVTSPDRFMCEIAVVLIEKHRSGSIDRREIPNLLSVLSKLGFESRARNKLIGTKLPTHSICSAH
jgi:hypothetical protein